VKSSKSFDEWKAHLGNFFKIVPAKNLEAIVKALSEPQSSSEKKSGRQIGWITGRGSFFLKLRSDISIARCLGGRPPALTELDVILLHDLAMGETSQPPFLREKELIYTRDLKEMKSRIQDNPAWVGFLLASPGVQSLARVASANEVMPPKTTYFYPKVPTGFTLMSLEQRIS
jgi:hypothetical protein